MCRKTCKPSIFSPPVVIGTISFAKSQCCSKTGDTAIVETEYGYHVMYFVGNSGVTYRDFMIENTLRSEAMTEWETGLVEAAELVVENTKYVKTDLTLSTSN